MPDPDGWHCSDCAGGVQPFFLFVDFLWTGYKFSGFIFCAKSAWELPLPRSVSASEVCSPSLAWVPRSLASWWSQGQRDLQHEEKVRIVCPTWGCLRNLAQLLTLPDILQSVVLQWCSWRLLKLVKSCACSKWPRGSWARWNQVRLSPETSIGEKSLLHLFWLLSPVLFSLSFWLNSAVCSWMPCLVQNLQRGSRHRILVHSSGLRLGQGRTVAPRLFSWEDNMDPGVLSPSFHRGVAHSGHSKFAKCHTNAATTAELSGVLVKQSPGMNEGWLASILKKKISLCEWEKSNVSSCYGTGRRAVIPRMLYS